MNFSHLNNEIKGYERISKASTHEWQLNDVINEEEINKDENFKRQDVAYK